MRPLLVISDAGFCGEQQEPLPDCLLLLLVGLPWNWFLLIINHNEDGSIVLLPAAAVCTLPTKESHYFRPALHCLSADWTQLDRDFFSSRPVNYYYSWESTRVEDDGVLPTNGQTGIIHVYYRAEKCSSILWCGGWLADDRRRQNYDC